MKADGLNLSAHFDKVYMRLCIEQPVWLDFESIENGKLKIEWPANDQWNDYSF